MSDLTAQLAAVAFVLAAFYLLFLPRPERFSRRAWPAWAIVTLFLLALLWSMWNETLRPLVQARETGRALSTALGLISILGALAVLVYGGFGIVAAVIQVMHDETVVRNNEIVRAGIKQFPRQVVRAAQRENWRRIYRAVRPGCLWMLLAFLLLALGGWLGSIKISLPSH